MTETAQLSRWDRFRGACIRIYVYLIDRIQEPSTLRGLVMAAGGLGVAFNMAKVEYILTIVLFAVGALGALMPDRLRDEAKRTKEAK